jgi:hypothetical protein
MVLVGNSAPQIVVVRYVVLMHKRRTKCVLKSLCALAQAQTRLRHRFNLRSRGEVFPIKVHF